MTGISNTYSSVLRNVGNIITIILSLITTQLKTIAGVKTLKHLSPPRKRRENIGNGGWGLKKRLWRRQIEYHLLVGAMVLLFFIFSRSSSTAVL